MKNIPLLMLILILFSCEDNIEPPVSLTDYQMEVISGNNQWAVTGRILPEPLVIRVTDKEGLPVENVPLSWTNAISPLEEGFSFSTNIQADNTTNAEGFAKAYLRMPTNTGQVFTGVSLFEPYDKRLTADYTLASVSFESESRPISFLYTAEKSGTDNQTGKIRSRLSLPVQIYIYGEDNEPINGYEVRWASPDLNYEIATDTEQHNSAGQWAENNEYYTLNTNNNGLSSILWRLGDTIGEQSMVASVLNADGTHFPGSPFTFTATAEDLIITIASVGGEAQTSAVTTGLAIPFQIYLEDELNDPVSGYEVTWTSTDNQFSMISTGANEVDANGDGSYSSLSNESGVSTARFVFGDQVGDFTLTASVYDQNGQHVMGSPIDFTVSSFPLGQLEDPRDAQVYETISMNGVVWMKENINFFTAQSACYDDNNAYCDIFGKLYNWEEAVNVCPLGWHLPSDQEWKDLESYLGMNSVDVNEFGNNRGESAEYGLMEGQWSGMDFRGGGYYSPRDGEYYFGKFDTDFNLYGYLETQWTSTPFNDDRSIERWIGTDFFSDAARYADSTNLKFSVRCVQDQ